MRKRLSVTMSWTKNKEYDLITDRSKLRNRALYWLSKRDYSEFDFRKKLDKVCEDEALKEDLLADFIAKDWLNESRYVQAVVKSKVASGVGLNRIINDLNPHGIKREQVSAFIETLNVDWFEKAKLTYEKKYGVTEIKDHKERAKRYRFLQYRGFAPDEIKYAMATDDNW